MALGLGLSLKNKGSVTGPSPTALYQVTPSNWNFTASSMSGNTFTESNIGTSTHQFVVDINTDSTWYIYNSVSTPASVTGTTRVNFTFTINITDNDGGIKMYLADSSSTNVAWNHSSVTSFKLFDNGVTTSGFETFSIDVSGTDIATSNDYIVIRDDSTSGLDNADFTMKDMTLTYYDF